MELRQYQREGLDDLMAYFEGDKGAGNPLVVVPTGGGKSYMIARWIQESMEKWSGLRFLLLTHRKELIAQNAEALLEAWPECPLGINSASLGQRDYDVPVLYAGIQSVCHHEERIGWRDIVIVDEAHLCPKDGDGMYRGLFCEMKERNPHLRVVGFTATPYRLKGGVLHEGEGRIFTDIAYEVGIRRLIDEGWLSMLKPRAVSDEAVADFRKVHVSGGEYVQKDLQRIIDTEELVAASVEEMFTHASECRHWLVFCSGIEHGHHVAAAIRERGLAVAEVYGHTPTQERDQTVRDFREGRIECLVNRDVFTNGFNAPCVDMVALLRATLSPGLYVQMVGRGSRLSPETGKDDCLVLDFGGNVMRHGPLDAVITERPDKGKGTVPAKKCPNCEMLVAIAARVCPYCEHEFEIDDSPKHGAQAGVESLLSSSTPEWEEVTKVRYGSWLGKSGIPTLRVDYSCGYLMTVSEWVCLQHLGFAKTKALRWWWQRAGIESSPPDLIEDAISRTCELKEPTRIKVDRSGKFPNITAYDYEPTRPEEADEAIPHPAF